MFGFCTKKELKALEATVASLEAKIDQVALLANDGQLALPETREVRERIWPLFAQGAEANLKMIEKVQKLP